MKRELLVLSPRMPPYNGADAQRARVMLKHLARHGFRATVVAASEASAAGVLDPELMATLPEHTEIVRVNAWPRKLLAPLGLRQHSLRAYRPWKAALSRLLDQRRFDAIFVSHTDFPLWPLALHWRVPFVLDWQDPWVSEYHAAPGAPTPPGGRLRYRVMQALARHYEADVASRAAAHVVVSGSYGKRLQTRYPQLRSARFVELPFAASREDLAAARSRPGARLPESRRRWWVYVGRGGDDLTFALGAFFEALARARAADPGAFADLGLLFAGTAYDPRSGRADISALATRYGIGDMVVEQTARLGLLDAFRLLEAAEALLIPGSDDPSYTASKLAPYLLTGKPLLAILHAQSPGHRLAGAHAATRFVAFDSCDASTRERLLRDIGRRWFEEPRPATSLAVDLGVAEAGAMTQGLCALLDEVVGR
jgi:glycosyltransferase involved in cell wall biosynthesis